MKYPRTGYGLRAQGGPSPAWVDGWARTPNGWQLEVIWRTRDRWATGLMPLEKALKRRIFEPMTPGLRTRGSETQKFAITNLASLSQLLEPRELIAPMLPGAHTTSRHAIYVAKGPAGRLYLPALLLLEHLWFWSPEATRAILTPNSLDAFLGVTGTAPSGPTAAIDSKLASNTPTQAALRGIAWLAECSQARTSWSSVLTQAHADRLDLTLPPAALSGWAWGVELSSGFLACELLSMQVQFTLPAPQYEIQIGKKLYSVDSDTYWRH